MKLLKGKVAVVTGGATGIGAAICQVFAREGAQVVVADIDLERAEATAASISAFSVKVDVRYEESVSELFLACDNVYGRLDILVNNAGIVPPKTPVWKLKLVDWEEVMAVNLRGAFLCTKHSLHLLKREGGSIINMSSRMGLFGAPMQSHYCASKFALRGLTEAVAQEIGPYGIRVNSICPGTVDTERFRERIAGRAKSSGTKIEEMIAKSFTDAAALRRVIQPDEIAETTLFLASDSASAITGEHIRIDAGR